MESPARAPDHAAHLGVAGRRGRVEDQRPSRHRFREHAVEHERVEVDVQVQAASKALDEIVADLMTGRMPEIDLEGLTLRR